MADAEVVIAFDPAGQTDVVIGQGPLQQLDFYISSNSSDGVRGIELDFLFPLATVVSDRQIGTTDPDDNGFFADDNLAISDLLDFPVGASRDVFVNQRLDIVQTLTATPELWFSLTLDTSAVAEGDYTIILSPGSSGISDGTLGGDGLPVVAPLLNSSFGLTVVAVPEPTGLVGLAAAVCGMMFARRRKQA